MTTGYSMHTKLDFELLVTNSTGSITKYSYLLSLQDGNGRLVRLFASIPLLKYGFPPISILITGQITIGLSATEDVGLCARLFVNLPVLKSWGSSTPSSGRDELVKVAIREVGVNSEESIFLNIE